MFVCPECGASQTAATYCATDGAPLAPVGDDLLLGQTIGPYRVARLLGVGGMGRVYKGVHPQIGSRVAIKVLSRECSDRRDLVDRFFSEAKAVNLIRHESIVNVLDFNVLPDGRPYIAMEYLDGAPLAAIIEHAQHAGTPLPLGGIARLCAEVLDALGAAHSKGIVHRDLKPDNIFITPAGRAKVLDFGIAKLQPELGGSATQSGSLLGTPHYMSPEQAAGRPVDARADLYAIGVILFECSTLHKPFTGESLYELLRKHVEMPPPSPRALRPDMPPDLEHVILTALAKLPEQRFGSAQATSTALQHATAQLPQAQWAPITPSAQARPPAGGWQPTPPASWAKNAPPSTVSGSSGQMITAAPTKARGKSKKGLAIGLAALAVAGGGIAVAVVASGDGGGNGAASTPGSGSAPVAVVTGSGGSGRASNDTWGDDPPTAPEPPGPDPVPEVPKAPPPPPRAQDTDDAMMDGYFDSLSPAQKKALPANLRKAIAKYGAFSKIPPLEKAKLAGEVAAFAQNIALDAANQANAALSDDDDAAAPAPAAPAGAPAGGYFQRHNVMPPSFNAKHVAVDQVIAWGIAEAKKNVPDAQLTWIDVSGVFPDGHADLTLPSFASSHGDITLRFVSPSHLARGPKLPRGVAPQYKNCSFYIVIGPDSGEIYDTSMLGDMECNAKPVPRPRCSMAALWKKALAHKKDLADAVAKLTYRERGWDFEIREGANAPIFDETYADDCR